MSEFLSTKNIPKLKKIISTDKYQLGEKYFIIYSFLHNFPFSGHCIAILRIIKNFALLKELTKHTSMIFRFSSF